MGMKRRDFVRTAALSGGIAAASVGLVVHGRNRVARHEPHGEDSIRELSLPGLDPTPQDDLLLQMQQDLVRAMAKPLEERRWAMVIDQRRCVGCHACTIGCVAENHLPPGVVYRPVVTRERGSFPNVGLSFTPRPCMQCDKPPCVPVCPVGATWKRADGVVAVDYDQCIGCRYCLTACPYGARTSDFGYSYTEATPDAEGATLGAKPHAAWEELPSFEYAKEWQRRGHESPIGNARKCHFCLHRLEIGALPMCTSTCIARATAFGDLSDPDSVVARLVASHDVQTLLPHLGTQPSVFYIL